MIFIKLSLQLCAPHGMEHQQAEDSINRVKREYSLWDAYGEVFALMFGSVIFFPYYLFIELLRLIFPGLRT